MNMSKSRDILKSLLLGILMLLNVGVFAQVDKLDRARQLLQAKDADNAILAIDSVILHPDTKNDYIAWTTRAFIYFEKYKRSERLKLNSSLRDTVVSSLKKSMKLKPDADYTTNNKKLITTIASGYYNLAKTLLQDSMDEIRSLRAYNKFKEIYLLGEPGANLVTKDIEYNLAVGSIYSDIFINDNTNLKAQNTAKVALLKVLELQPENPTAKINMGLMYYNQAVNLSKSAALDIDITQVEIIQENIVKLAKQAEQFILPVYKADNKNAKAVHALYYIYRMLLETKKMEEFQIKCKELGINLD